MRKSIFKAVATVTVFSVITRTLSFIFKIYLSRTVGAEVMGLYQIALSFFFLFAALSSSGIMTVLSRKTAETRALDSNNKGYALLTSALIIALLVAIATFLMVFFLRPYLHLIVSDDRAISPLLIMLPAMASTSVYMAIRSWFWGSKKFLHFSITETLEEVLRIIFTLLFVSGVISGISGAYGIALAFLISDFVVAVILLIMYFAKGGKLQKPAPFKDLVKPAAPVTAMRVFGSLIGTLMAILLPMRLIAGGFSVSEATQAFGRIAGMASPLLFAPNAIIGSLAIVLIPEMSESSVKKDYATLNKNINSGVTFALAVSGIFLIIYAALGRDLTVLIFNDVQSGEYLAVAAWLLIIMPVHQMISSAMNGIGMEKQAFLSYSVSTIFMVASVFFLTPVIGVYSVVIANFVCLLICSATNMRFLKKRTGLRFEFLKPFALIAVFAYPSVFLASTINSLLKPHTGWFGLVAGAAAATVLYVVLIQIFGLVDFGGFVKLKFNKKKKLSVS
jgi:stage V sporulation protein B